MRITLPSASRYFGAAHFGFSTPGSAQVLDQRDVAGRVAADDVGVPVAIPIEAARRRQRPELHVIGLLLEITRREELRRAIRGQFAGVFDERHAAVLVAHDQVDVPVLVPVDRGRRDHLQVHHQRLAVGGLQPFAGRVFRRGARPKVLEVSEAIQELATQQIQVAVAVEVGKVRRRPAEDLDWLFACHDFHRRFVLRLGGRAGVAGEIHKAP